MTDTMPGNVHDPADPLRGSRPLTPERIRRLLGVLAHFRGEAGFYAAVGQHAQGSAAAPELDILGSDPSDLEQDLARLQVLWAFSDLWGTGAVEDAFGFIEQQIADLQQERGGLPAAMAAEVDIELELLRSITTDELNAIEAHGQEIGAALEIPVSEPRPAEVQRIGPDDPDAHAWLAENGQEVPLAANRFADRDEARELVDELYAAGAVRVVIAADCIRDDEYEQSLGGPYADGLRVQLPADPALRRAVFGIVDREARDEGFDSEPDTGQEVVFLWWD